MSAEKDPRHHIQAARVNELIAAALAFREAPQELTQAWATLRPTNDEAAQVLIEATQWNRVDTVVALLHLGAPPSHSPPHVVDREGQAQDGVTVMLQKVGEDLSLFEAYASVAARWSTTPDKIEAYRAKIEDRLSWTHVLGQFPNMQAQEPALLHIRQWLGAWAAGVELTGAMDEPQASSVEHDSSERAPNPIGRPRL